MAVVRKLTDVVVPFLEPGESVQQVFLAQAGPINPMFATFLQFLLQWRMIAVTDRAIVVMKTNRATTVPTEASGVVVRLPRNLRVAGRGLRVAIGLPMPPFCPIG